jgi:hypothetical protein
MHQDLKMWGGQGQGFPNAVIPNPTLSAASLKRRQKVWAKPHIKMKKPSDFLVFLTGGVFTYLDNRILC